MENTKNIIIIGAVVILIGGIFYNIYPKQVEVIKIENLCEGEDCSNIPMPLNPPMGTISSNSVQSEKIDEHLTIDNTLREVNFCGETYKEQFCHPPSTPLGI